MSNEEPWNKWYRPDDAAGSDATQDMTFRSPMPQTPPPNAGAGRGSWQQPPASPKPPQSPQSPGYGRQAPGRGNGAQGYGGAGANYDKTRAYGGSPYKSSRTYGGGTPTRGGGGRNWRFWGQPGRRGRRIALYLGILVLVIIVAVGGSYFWINGKLNKTVTLPTASVTSSGTNWLIAGSDARTGITRAERAKLHLGATGADASDSLMLLHTGSGKPVLISIPRDSYVPIPGHGSNKINAALAIGGPALLVQTIESVTGLRIDHYMSIGFGGLADIVNTVGGVHICLPAPVKDPYSHADLKAGCQNLNGTQAIAFVRARHAFATSDLQRIQDQRAFLQALLSKATSPGVYLNPFVALPFASTAASSIAVDKGTSLQALLQVAFALRGPQTGTVPIASANYQTPNAGDAVKWDTPNALKLFGALKADKPVPAGLLTGTKVG